jgi:hypothetical protein
MAAFAAAAARLRRAVALAVTLAVAAGLTVAVAGPADAAASGVPAGRFRVGVGVTVWHERWTGAAGPESAWVASVNLAFRNVHATVTSTGSLGHRLTVPAAAAVTHASVAINGDFFDGNGVPLGGLMQGGHMLRSPKHGWNAQLSITADGHARIGPVNFQARISSIKGSSERMNSVNTVTDAKAGNITMITAAQTPQITHQSCLYAVGILHGSVLTMTALQHRTSTTRLGGTQRALLACTGSTRTWLLKHAQPGRHLRVSSHIAGGSPRSLLSGGRQLLRGGRPFNDKPGMITFGVNPETAVCVSANGRRLLLVAIDGRANHPGGSAGVTMAQLTSFLMAKGCYDALMLDGGGSTTFVARVRGQERLLNRPTDHFGPRPVPDVLVVTS